MTCWDRLEDAENWQYGRERNSGSNGKYKNCKDGYKFLKNIDIALTHIPPFGIGDGAQPIGCVELLKVLKESSCLLHVFGHRHSGYGVYYDGERMYVNAAMVKDPQQLNLPIIIDLKKN